MVLGKSSSPARRHSFDRHIYLRCALGVTLHPAQLDAGGFVGRNVSFCAEGKDWPLQSASAARSAAALRELACVKAVPDTHFV